MYINDTDVGLNNFTSKFADDTETGNSIIHDRDRMSLQEDLIKISEWCERWEMTFTVNKCHVLHHVSTINKQYEYEMNGVKLESVQCVKYLGVVIASSLTFCQQCKDAAGKANRMLGFINRNFSFKNKDTIAPLCISLVKTSSGVRRAVLVASPCKGYSETRNCPAKVEVEIDSTKPVFTRGKDRSERKK